MLKVNWSICNCPTFAICQHIIMSISNIFHTILLQRHPDGQKAEICETSPRLAAAQIGESCSCTQGCVWLCCYVSQKCDEYLNCILALSVNLCHGRGSVVQRKIFPLLRRFCTWWKGVPVSYLLSYHQLNHRFITTNRNKKLIEVYTNTCKWVETFKLSGIVTTCLLRIIYLKELCKFSTQNVMSISFPSCLFGKGVNSKLIAKLALRYKKFL